MRRLGSLAGLLLVAILVAPVPAGAAPIGGLIIVPGESIDLVAIRVRTTGGCPAQADAFYATARGNGFPPDGQVVTANTAAGLSHTAGFDVYFAQTMKDFAVDNGATLGGRYDITVFCIDSFTQNSFGEFTGSLRFTTPTKFEAIGAAKPTGPPPPPAPINGGSAGDPGAAPGQAPIPAAPPGSGADAVAAPRQADESSVVPFLLIFLIPVGLLIVLVVALALRRRKRSVAAVVAVLAAVIAVTLPGHRPAVADPGVSIGVVIPGSTTTTTPAPTTSTTSTTTTALPVQPNGSGPRLSYTGAAVGGLVIAGLALLVAGAVTVLISRRRRAIPRQ